MSSAIGLNVGEMERLVKKFQGASQQLHSSQIGVNGAVLAAWWAGPVAINFRAAWQASLSPTLLRRSADLLVVSERLAQQISEQITASRADGGAAGRPGLGSQGPGAGSGGIDIDWGDLWDFRGDATLTFRTILALNTYRQLAQVSSAAKVVVPIFSNGLIGRQLIQRVPQLSFLGSPTASMALRGLGAVTSGIATVQGVHNLWQQGNPIEAFQRDPGSYASDVAGTIFNGSATAFFIAPNPVTGAILVVAGVAYIGTEIWDHWDEISGVVGDAWDRGGELLGDAWDKGGDVLGSAVDTGREFLGDAADGLSAVGNFLGL